MAWTPKRVQITSNEAISDLVYRIQSHCFKRLTIELFQGKTPLYFFAGLDLTALKFIIVLIHLIKIIQEAEDSLVNEEPEFDGRQMSNLALSIFLTQAAVAYSVDNEDDD